MKLISIAWSTAPRVPGVRPTDVGRIKCEQPTTALEGWRFSIRGSNCFLVSPPGWTSDQNNKKRDEKGPSTVFGPMSMRDVYLEWHATAEADIEAICKLTKWDSEPFGQRAEPVDGGKSILAQIPAGQLGDA